MATPEATVISAVCKNKDIHVILGEDAKLFGDYGDVFNFLKDYYVKYRGVPDQQLLQDRFGDINLPESVGKTQFHVDELKNYYITNRMDTIMTKAQDALKASGESPAKLYEKLVTSLAEVGRYTANSRDLDITDLDAAEEHFRKLREISSANNGVPGIPFGYKSIDSAYTTGMAGGHLVVMFGYTGRMKSYFAIDIAINAHNQGYKPMVISLEMTPEEQMERIYTRMGRGQFKQSSLSRGEVPLDDIRAWGKKKFDDANDFVVVSNEGIYEFTPNVINAKADVHNPDIIILDYAQLFKDNAKTPQMTPRMLNFSREVKMLANARGIPIILLSSVTDEEGDKRDTPPMLSQVSWSSGIEYDANLAIAVHKHDNSSLLEITGRKNRNGPLFNFYLDVDIDNGIWTEKFDL